MEFNKFTWIGLFLWNYDFLMYGNDIVLTQDYSILRCKQVSQSLQFQVGSRKKM